MAIKIRFLHEHQLAVSVVRGNLSYADLQEHRRQVAATPGYSPVFRLLFDARRATAFSVTADEIRDFAEFAQPGKPRFSRMAMLVSEDLGFGLARIFQAYTGRHSEQTLRIFRDQTEAWTWLTGD